MSRSVQRIRRRFAVRTSPIHGRGVFALRYIAKHTRIIEYKGELISHEEADESNGEEHENPNHTMLWAVSDEIVIDATKRGNSARWINHSCAPNCEPEDEGNRIFIETRRDIRPGEELTYDYNLELSEPHTPAAKREYLCYCSARRCRGTMLGSKC